MEGLLVVYLGCILIALALGYDRGGWHSTEKGQDAKHAEAAGTAGGLTVGQRIFHQRLMTVAARDDDACTLQHLSTAAKQLAAPRSTVFKLPLAAPRSTSKDSLPSPMILPAPRVPLPLPAGLAAASQRVWPQSADEDSELLLQSHDRDEDRVSADSGSLNALSPMPQRPPPTVRSRQRTESAQGGMGNHYELPSLLTSLLGLHTAESQRPASARSPGVHEFRKRAEIFEPGAAMRVQKSRASSHNQYYRPLEA